MATLTDNQEKLAMLEFVMECLDAKLNTVSKLGYEDPERMRIEKMCDITFKDTMDKMLALNRLICQQQNNGRVTMKRVVEYHTSKVFWPVHQERPVHKRHEQESLVQGSREQVEEDHRLAQKLDDEEQDRGQNRDAEKIRCAERREQERREQERLAQEKRDQEKTDHELALKLSRMS